MVNDSLRDGLNSEARFVNILKNKDIIKYPTREENMFEHWDVQYGSKKYDVKTIKRINRYSNKTSEFTWVEFTNVNGKNGWIFGKSDYIAFDLMFKWVIIDREKLKNMVLSRLKDRTIRIKDSSPKTYLPYRRSGRDDTIVLVPVADIEEIADMVKYV